VNFAFLSLLFSVIPYALVAWGYAWLIDGGAREFWGALGALVAARLFFAVIETLGSILTWRLWGRQQVIDRFLMVLRGNQFPQRKFPDDDFLNYIQSVANSRPLRSATSHGADRTEMKACRLLALLCLLGASGCSNSTTMELVCVGKVTFGSNTFSDTLILRIDGMDMKISGEAGTTSTFEGTGYKVCSNSTNEMEFEGYTFECGNGKATRHGILNKVLGKLRMTRTDLGERFVGDYICKKAQRVLE